MTLAMIVHELATNSLKYGALSVETGTLDVSGTSDEEEVCIVWTERGGPTVITSGSEGYGSRLLRYSVTRQLGGTIKTDWADDGVIVTITMNATRLSE
jgi:two-component sensor histidine kinase